MSGREAGWRSIYGTSPVTTVCYIFIGYEKNYTYNQAEITRNRKCLLPNTFCLTKTQHDMKKLGKLDGKNKLYIHVLDCVFHTHNDQGNEVRNEIHFGTKISLSM